MSVICTWIYKQIQGYFGTPEYGGLMHLGDGKVDKDAEGMT